MLLILEYTLTVLLNLFYIHPTLINLGDPENKDDVTHVTRNKLALTPRGARSQSRVWLLHLPPRSSWPRRTLSQTPAAQGLSRSSRTAWEWPAWIPCPGSKPFTLSGLTPSDANQELEQSVLTIGCPGSENMTLMSCRCFKIGSSYSSTKRKKKFLVSFGNTTHPHVAFQSHMAAAYTPRCWIMSPVGILFSSSNDSQQASEHGALVTNAWHEDSTAHARAKSPDCSHTSTSCHCKQGSERPHEDAELL